MQALLDKGADVNAKQNDGLTALMTASPSGRVDFVQALIAKGADVNAKDNNDLTALMATRTPKSEPYWSGQARDHDSRWT